MKVFGAAEGAGADVEVLLLLPLAAPNRLGVGVEDDEVVELVTLVGLLARKEKAGFGAAEAGSVQDEIMTEINKTAENSN